VPVVDQDEGTAHPMIKVLAALDRAQETITRGARYGGRPLLSAR
jgi:hypothetical protein